MDNWMTFDWADLPSANPPEVLKPQTGCYEVAIRVKGNGEPEWSAAVFSVFEIEGEQTAPEFVRFLGTDIKEHLHLIADVKEREQRGN